MNSEILYKAEEIALKRTKEFYQLIQDIGIPEYDMLFDDFIKLNEREIKTENMVYHSILRAIKEFEKELKF
jgi:hypothetical protein